MLDFKLEDLKLGQKVKVDGDEYTVVAVADDSFLASDGTPFCLNKLAHSEVEVLDEVVPEADIELDEDVIEHIRWVAAHTGVRHVTLPEAA